MKALVLSSGGVDSTTALALAVSRYGKDNVIALSVSYGQKHDKEIQAAKAVSAFYGVEQLFLDLSKIFQYSNCSLLQQSTEEIPEENIILENVHSSMGLSRKVPINLTVWIDPVAYYNMPYAKKVKVAKLIGAVNWKNKGKNKHMLLIVPGRIGTSFPELGVPTTFADISIAQYERF